jgi:hypothetical protein
MISKSALRSHQSFVDDFGSSLLPRNVVNFHARQGHVASFVLRSYPVLLYDTIEMGLCFGGS